MDLSIEVCKAIAIRYGLPLQFVIKEFHLMDALGQVATFVSSQPDSLIFKGGTALNKVYAQSTQRFSEDIDFDLVTDDAKNSLRDFCKRLASGIAGYRITEFRRIRETIQFYCVYDNKILEGRDHIRIDIAPKSLITAKQVESRTAVSDFTSASVSGLKVYAIEDLTARKLHALATRTEGKDVYDVHTAIPLCAKGTLRIAIERMLESEKEKGTAESFIEKTLSALEGSDPKEMEKRTNPFIPLSLRPKSWEELKNDLKRELEMMGN